LLFAVRGQTIASSLFTGLGIAAKVWPVAILPLVLLAPIQRRNFGRIFTGMLAALTAVVLAHLPWLIIAPSHALGYLGYFHSRGLQIESLPANAVMLLSQLLHSRVSSVWEWGAFDIVSPVMSSWAAMISTLLAPLTYLVILFLYSRRIGGKQNVELTILGFLAVGFCVLLTAKVFSPQYLLWLCPATLALDLRRTWKIFACFVLVCLLTKLELRFYPALVDQKIDAISVLTLRNLAACGAALVVVGELRRMQIPRAANSET
jgi:uncharacterized membrane protein